MKWKVFFIIFLTVIIGMLSIKAIESLNESYEKHIIQEQMKKNFSNDFLHESPSQLLERILKNEKLESIYVSVIDDIKQFNTITSIVGVILLILISYISTLCVFRVTNKKLHSH